MSESRRCCAETADSLRHQTPTNDPVSEYTDLAGAHDWVCGVHSCPSGHPHRTRRHRARQEAGSRIRDHREAARKQRRLRRSPCRVLHRWAWRLHPALGLHAGFLERRQSCVSFELPNWAWHWPLHIQQKASVISPMGSNAIIENSRCGAAGALTRKQAGVSIAVQGQH